ncbi:MAG: transcriptional regulator [Acidimicrobiia bacterium]|nr:transcriptional regulator [Acidimicrobiia bacterium]
MAPESLVAALMKLTEVVQTERTLGGTLARVAETAVLSVPGCDAASVTISVEGRPATAAMTARVALELDLAQYDADDGPCVEALKGGRTIRFDLVDPGDAYPHFAVGAQRAGVRGVLSIPARWGTDIVGVLNLYSFGGTFDESAVSVAQVLGAQVGIAISRSPEFSAARAVVEQAQRDADDSAEIARATGLLAITEACTIEQAEGLLREASNHEEQPLIDIAQRIIDQHRNSG